MRRIDVMKGSDWTFTDVAIAILISAGTTIAIAVGILTFLAIAATFFVDSFSPSPSELVGLVGLVVTVGGLIFAVFISVAAIDAYRHVRNLNDAATNFQQMSLMVDGRLERYANDFLRLLTVELRHNLSQEATDQKAQRRRARSVNRTMFERGMFCARTPCISTETRLSHVRELNTEGVAECCSKSELPSALEDLAAVWMAKEGTDELKHEAKEAWVKLNKCFNWD